MNNLKRALVSVLLSLSLFSLTAQQTRIRIIRNDKEKKIDVFAGQDAFASFRYRDDIEKPFIFPVFSPSDHVITRGFPVEPGKGERIDHPHQTGIWFNHGNVNGLDFWNNSSEIPDAEKHKYGHIRVRSIDKTKGGKNGIISLTADWMDQEGNRILVEKTDWIFSAEKNTRFIDHVTVLIAAREKVIITDNKEGLFAIRVARQLEMPSNELLILTDEDGKPAVKRTNNNLGVTGMYTSSSGLKGDKVWGTRNKWVLLRGKQDGVITTIGIFDHPANKGFPAYSHARGYGLFSLNNFGQNSYDPGKEKIIYEMKEGESVTLRHRMIIRSGDEITPDQADSFFEDFSMKYMDVK